MILMNSIQDLCVMTQNYICTLKKKRFNFKVTKMLLEKALLMSLDDLSPAFVPFPLQHEAF